MFESDPHYDFDEDFITNSCSSKQQNTLSNTEAPKRKTIEVSCEENTVIKKKICTPASSFAEKCKHFLQELKRSNYTKDKSDLNAETNSAKIVNVPVNFSNKKVVPRKFPGPAGLLNSNNISNCSRTSLKNFTKNTDEEILCSQMSAGLFSSPSWQHIQEYYDPFPTKYNIAWIKSRAISGELTCQKAPFLAVIVKNISPMKEKTPRVMLSLQDPTGEMEGTLQNKLSEAYESKLAVGSVLVLRSFNVLATNFGRTHYVYITQKNIVAICNNVNGRFDFLKLQDVDLRDLQETAENVTVQNGASLRTSTPLKHCKYENSTQKAPPDINLQSITKPPQETPTNSLVKKKFDFKTMKMSNKLNDNSKNHNLAEFSDKYVNNFKSIFDDSSFSEANLSLKDVNSRGEIHVENLEHSQIVQTAFDGVDLENFFDEF